MAATSATVGETTSAVSATTSALGATRALVEGGVVVVELTEQVEIVDTSKS